MVANEFEQSLRRLAEHVDIARLAAGRKGLERETLRTRTDGALAQTDHPEGLGSALTNAFITTDFSEALLEFVTPAFDDIGTTEQFLADLHRFTYGALGDERLWPNSMPCRVGGDDAIPLARYGSSNVGTMKTVYRRGLGYRYGRTMQTIAGLHFNYSIPTELWPGLAAAAGFAGDVDEFRSVRYLGLVRNHRRLGWLLLYLFGASPAMCKSFLDDSERMLPSLNDDTVFEPYATSLRMSDLGYSNKAQARLAISLNSLDDYVAGLCRAITTPEADYEAIGVKVDGIYRQLNANVLQIENEYYSPMRPKRVARSGERPTLALCRGGIEYVELRSVDLNPYAPTGIALTDAHFIELFLLYCLIKPSPLLDTEELAQAARNQALTARFGRDPALLLVRHGTELLLTDWAAKIVDELAALAALIDKAAGTEFSAAVNVARARVADAGETPSARLIAELGDRGASFIEHGLAQAAQHRRTLAATPVAADRLDEFQREAAESVARARSIEADDEISFDEYLQQYFATPC